MTRPAAAEAAEAAAGDARPVVIVTRPEPQADTWVAQLQALGVRALALPLLGIDGPAEPGEAQAAFEALPGCALAMFVSPSAVLRWRALAPSGWQWPAGTLAGATGPGTAQALRQAGVPDAAIVMPPIDAGHFDSEALWAVLQPRRDWRGAAVQVVRGEGGRDWLAGALRDAGAHVRFVTAYRRTAPVLTPEQAAGLAVALAAPEAHCWLFSSSEAVGQLPGLAPDMAPGVAWARHQALATHERIATAARALGLQRVGLVAPDPAAVALALTAGLSDTSGAPGQPDPA